MKSFQFEEYDLELIYRKLTAPSKPRTIKACDFFNRPNLIVPLQDKIAQTVRQNSESNR